MPHALRAGASIVVLVLVACTSAGPEATQRSSTGPAATNTASSAATTAPASALIELPRLPPQGVAAQWSTRRGIGVDLLTMRGTRIVRLRGFTIGGAWAGAPGTLCLTRRHLDYRLHVAGHVLRETPYTDARPEPGDVHVSGAPSESGRWLWTDRSSRSPVLLGQWQEQISECSLPVAMVGDPAGWSVLTGSTSPAHAPKSLALGWSPDGRAVVGVEGGPCNGVTKPRTGVYAVAVPGGSMVRIPTPRGSYHFETWARM
jgi:hypothetical protein